MNKVQTNYKQYLDTNLQNERVLSYFYWFRLLFAFILIIHHFTSFHELLIMVVKAYICNSTLFVIGHVLLHIFFIYMYEENFDSNIGSLPFYHHFADPSVLSKLRYKWRTGNRLQHILYLMGVVHNIPPLFMGAIYIVNDIEYIIHELYHTPSSNQQLSFLHRIDRYSMYCFRGMFSFTERIGFSNKKRHKIHHEADFNHVNEFTDTYMFPVNFILERFANTLFKLSLYFYKYSVSGVLTALQIILMGFAHILYTNLLTVTQNESNQISTVLFSGFSIVSLFVCGERFGLHPTIFPFYIAINNLK